MYKEIINRAADHLKQKGITVAINYGNPNTDKELAEFETVFGIKFPNDLQILYSEIGSGFSLDWDDPNDDNCHASFELMSIPDILKERKDIRQGIWGKLPTINLNRRKNSTAAKYSIEFMLRNFVFIKWPINCDYLSYNIDMGTIHYDTNAEWDCWNIYFISNGISELFKNWGNVCFQMPSIYGFSDWVSMNGAQLWGDRYKYKLRGV